MSQSKSSVKSWPITVDPFLGRPRSVERGVVATGAHRSQPATQRPTVRFVRGVRTTGLYAVPSGDGNTIQLRVLISSFSRSVETADIRIFQRVDDELHPLFFQTVQVPAGGARQIVVSDVENRTIEIEVDLSSERLHPSASVTERFIADGALVVLDYRSPADFIPV